MDEEGAEQGMIQLWAAPGAAARLLCWSAECYGAAGPRYLGLIAEILG